MMKKITVRNKKGNLVQLTPYIEIGSRDSRKRFVTSEQFSVNDFTTNAKYTFIPLITCPTITVWDVLTGKVFQKLLDFKREIVDTIEKNYIRHLENIIHYSVTKEYDNKLNGKK